MTYSNIIDDGSRTSPAGYGSQKRGLKSLKWELKWRYGFNNVHRAAWVVSCSGEWHFELAERVDEVNHPQGLCSQRGDELCGFLVPGSRTHTEYTLGGLWRHPGGFYITERSCKSSVYFRVNLRHWVYSLSWIFLLFRVDQVLLKSGKCLIWSFMEEHNLC